jgi:hypothetical protein
MGRMPIDFHRLFAFAPSSSFFAAGTKSNLPQQRCHWHLGEESTVAARLRSTSLRTLNLPL